MLLKRNIESYVTIDGQATNVVYFGQRQTCRYCTEFVHNGISCVQNKKLLVQKTYANVAKQTDTTPTVPKPTTSKPKPSFAKLFGPKPKEASQQGLKPMTRSAKAAEAAIVATKQPEANLSNVSIPQSQTLTPSSNMAPPALPTNGPSANRMCTRQTSDGNETDGSSTSSSSKRRGGRPPGKKFRHGDDANEEVELQN